MFVVDQSQILHGDFIFFCSLSLLGPLIALLRGTSEVNNFGLLNFDHRLKTLVERFEDFVFTLIHIAQFFHDLRENVFVS